MANKDVVFAAFGFNENIGMGVLEWIFDHFEIDGTSLILTCLYTTPSNKSEFMEVAENKYLPRCIKEKFEAKILIPQGNGDGLLLELINKHGMTKLITTTLWISDILEDYAMNLSCRIWGIASREVVFIRDKSVGKMKMREYLPNEDDLHKQTLQQHPLNKNNVFIALDFYIPDGEKALDWIFQNFEKEKTKLVITTLYAEEESCATEFIEAAQSNYIKRCQTKKFEAVMLVPHAKRSRDITLELITKHGMKRLVLSTLWLSYVLEGLGTIPNNPCMIWVLQFNTGKLVHFRGAREIKLLQIENDLHQQKIERHLLTKEYEKLIIDETKNASASGIGYFIKIKKPESQKRLEISQKLLVVNKRIRDLQRGKYPLHLQVESRRVEGEQNVLQEQQNKSKERHKSLQDAERLYKGTNRSDFTLQELADATQNFSNSLILGKGAFGCVYKGVLRGTIVAVKRLNSQCTKGMKAFNREVDILTSKRHPNLVILMGACYEVSALVYEFLPNGSLEDHLNHKNKTSLTWRVRTSILAEICLALTFLHSSTPNMVIHGDLKPDNVLLDANFVSKLGDFGISHLIERTDTTALCVTSNIMGTIGYIDPEFIQTGQLTEKSDVFAFGVIVLRLITGEPPIGVVSKVRESVKNKKLHKIIDKSAGKWPSDHAEELTMLGLRCVQTSTSDRPELFNDVWPIFERLRRP